ncbi:MAG: hypothetical protein K0Q76_911 [Panacagrimonas sp.]|nr:hypothetical protein [Panacagrimonas sp.]MCC2655803.1 hypothetical protein [Panacagrimonas sp.]
MKIRNAAILAVLSLGVAMSACKKNDDGPMEKATDAIGDATDSRDNENLKDAGENVKDAAENVKEEVKDATN